MELGRTRLRDEDLDVPVALLGEDASVEQIERRVVAAATAVLGGKPRIGVFRLRVLVEIAQPAVARRRIDVEVVFLDVLAAVALVAGEAEGPLLQDRITAVPEREREAEPLLLV